MTSILIVITVVILLIIGIVFACVFFMDEEMSNDGYTEGSYDRDTEFDYPAYSDED